MDSTLGAFIEARLKAQGLSVRSFALKLGMGSSYVSKVLTDKLAVPYKRIGKWSDALGLNGAAAAEFKELALLRLSPVEVRELVEGLRREAAKQPGRRTRK